MTTATKAPPKLSIADEIIISDPCYVDDEGRAEHWLATTISNAAGEWEASVELIELEHPWGKRVARLILTRLDAELTAQVSDVATVGVDSGQMFMGPIESLPLDYDLICRDNADYHAADPTSGGVVSSTGIGDGGYGVFVTAAVDGRPGKVEVVFLTEEDL